MEFLTIARGADVMESMMEQVEEEIVDLLQMGPESAGELSEMLDESTEKLILASYPSIREGVVTALRILEHDGVIQKSDRFPAMWELVRTT